MNLNEDKYSARSGQLFQTVIGFTAKLGHGFIGSEHILWGIASEHDEIAAMVLKRHGMEAELIEEYLTEHDHDAAIGGGTRAIQISKEAEQIAVIAEEQQKKCGHQTIEPEHFLLGILQTEECAAAQMLMSLDVDLNVLVDELTGYMESPKQMRDNEKSESEKKQSFKTLEKYSRDLTAEAKRENLDPMIGREAEVERMVQILSRRQKNNPVLIGEPGVGKTAVVEGLAERIVDGRIPKNLVGKRVLSLDLTGMLSGARFRGDFEERVTSFLDEAKAAGDVLLFVDELHTLIGAGSGSGDGAMDAANIFKPMLARGELQVIGATTLQEYRRYIEKDAALERRFQPVIVEEPSKEDAVRILSGLRERYENFHELTITDEAIRAAVELSARYVGDRFLPDKAIDLMDEAASRIRIRGMTVPPHLEKLDNEIQVIRNEKKKAAQAQDYEKAAVLRDQESKLSQLLEEKQTLWQQEQGSSVSAEDVAAVVSAWTKIPVTMLTEDENQRLIQLEEILHQRIIGQDEAVTAVARAIRRGRTGVADPNRPIGSFLFLGPTGVGKTEVCRALAEVLFHDEGAMIRMDMSEYMESHTVSKLIGSPPGYVGYNEGGQLTEQVRRKPYSIILFDEIEKAHPDVWNALLQIMDDGRLTDARGRTVSFKNTIIVMTSNIGARNILGKSSLGFANTKNIGETRPVEDIRSRVMDEVKRVFQPEFLNRLDETIVFHQLERDHIKIIARSLTDRLTARLKKQGVNLLVEDSAIEVLTEKGFDPAYGARPLRRTIQSTLETGIADRMLDSNYSSSDNIIATGKDGEIKLKIHKKRSRKKLVEVQ